MGAFGIWQWIVILAIVLILFARPGKISGIMGDFGKGMNKFKSGLKDGEADAVEASDAEVIEATPAPKKKAAAKKPAAKKTAKKKTAKKKTATKKAAKKAKAKS